MWTPKRIVMLVLGFALFCTGYFAYSYALGGIDGLPPLPEAYLDPRKEDFVLPQPKPNQVEDKLRQAFGPECPEVKLPIKLQLSRNDMVVAAESFEFDDDGRLVLLKFRVALFGKPKDDGKGVEINTISSNIAYLRFDRPFKNKTINPNEMNGRKIVGAELMGNIEIINNRRTAARDDDLELFIVTGPLFYEESTHLVWTYDNVHLTDRSSKPKPHEVCGKGMEMELVSEQPPAAPGHKPAQAHQDSITGVKRIVLQSNVEMDLYIDGQSSFMGKPADKKGEEKSKVVERTTAEQPPTEAKNVVAKTSEAPEKAHLHIRTPGRFMYFFHKDFDTAHFEVTPGNQPAAAAAPQSPTSVHVDKRNEKLNTHDQLFCERLDLQLTRKDAKPADKNAKPGDKNAKPAAAAKPAGSDSGSPEQNVQIESAHAFGKKVTLTSDEQKFSATDVVELHHQADTKTTTLIGAPNLVAEKEGSTMVTPQLFIAEQTAAGSGKTYQRVTASGPGHIDMLDKKTNKKNQHAYWNNSLLSTKDEHALTPKGELQDLLVFTGKARFVTDAHGPSSEESLEADKLTVWLSSSDKPVEKATPAPSAGTDQVGGARVQHIEAVGNVTAKSSEMNIHDTGRLVVWFKDAPPGTLPAAKEVSAKATVLPADNAGNPASLPPPPVPGDGPKPLPPGPALEVTPPPPPPIQSDKTAVVVSGPPAPPAKGTTGPAKKDEPRPIDLTARSVEAYVLRVETGKGEPQNTLDHLFTEGSVHVHQAPAKDGDQGTDIRGETLSMFAYPEGKLLTVTGNEDNLAKLLMDKILIVGPEVNIDQVQNKVWVTGAGAMRIDSTTTLGGKPLEKSVPLDIMWQKSMLISGRYGEFNSGIQATQDEPMQKEARLACNTLNVTFDKPISLKEGPRDDKASPKVQTLLCDKDAWVEDKSFEGGKVMKYQRIVALTLTLEALDEENDNSHKADDKKNEGHQVRATGPGFLKMWQLSGEDPTAPSKNNPNPQTSAKPPIADGGTTTLPAGKATVANGSTASPTGKPPAVKPAAKEAEPKMTLVTFEQSMYGNSRTNFASFRKNVKVLSVPVDSPDVDVGDGNRYIDVMLARLPAGSMYLSCNHLEVWTRQEKGKNYQEMYAREQAVVQGPDFWGRAETIHFDELKDQVIFEGGPGGMAELTKFARAGDQGQPLKGQKILYNRTTGEMRVEHTTSLEAN